MPLLTEEEKKEIEALPPYPMTVSKILVDVIDGEFYSIVGDDSFKRIPHFSKDFPKNVNLNGFIGKFGGITNPGLTFIGKLN